ncbi:transcription initiation factor TFIIH subunit 4 [Nematocida sp. AWRm80]|nr:transcription initiation factor TFIIH subunit 4 [Nematocida sp. AWRm80]
MLYSTPLGNTSIHAFRLVIKDQKTKPCAIQCSCKHTLSMAENIYIPNGYSVEKRLFPDINQLEEINLMVSSVVEQFFQCIAKASVDLKYNSSVLLSIIRLLNTEEKATLFSLLTSSISVQWIKKEWIHLLSILEMVSVQEGFYKLENRIRESLIRLFTKIQPDKVLVQTDEIAIEEENGSYNTMLYKIISNKSDSSPVIRILMTRTGIINQEGITHKGFNFLLSGRKNQMWALILAHLQGSDNLSEELELFCEILSKDPKRVYLLDKKEEKGGILQLFKALGLLRTAGSKVIFNKSISFLFDDTQNKNKFLSLESNFKMYIYGNYPLHLFIIQLFSTRIREFPNLLVVTINEDSLNNAFSLGITTEQIKEYLLSNAIYPIDENVLGQITLWEKRRKRIFPWDSYLLNNFLNYKDYLLVESFCTNSNINHRSYKDKRILIVDVNQYPLVKTFIKTNIK